MLVTMTESAQARAENRAAHQAYPRAPLPTRVPRGETPKEEPAAVTKLRQPVKAATPGSSVAPRSRSAPVWMPPTVLMSV